MKYKTIIFICVAITIVVFVLFRFFNTPKQNTEVASVSQVQSTLAMQTSEGIVTVDVTPKTLAAGSQAQFTIKFSTHSGDLNYDMVNIASLSDDTGTKYKALSWNGNMGGHHVEGVLTFPIISKSAKKVTLMIPSIDNKDRVFSWEFKQ